MTDTPKWAIRTVLVELTSTSAGTVLENWQPGPILATCARRSDARKVQRAVKAAVQKRQRRVVR